jgi:hypothetical protein
MARRDECSGEKGAGDKIWVIEWMQELAVEAKAAQCGEVRATPQEQWDDLRGERG